MIGSFLLDTHALLWAIDGSKKLSKTARRILADEQSDLVVSIASLWEVGLKHQAGKLELGQPLNRFLGGIFEQSAWRVLPVMEGHLLALCTLPMLHKDPFDRMLVAQAKAEGLTLLTVDPAIAQYGVPITW
jgi:PIN domain nuclease of toxin-antitoxin system